MCLDLTLDKIKFIKQVKDSSPFTCNQSLLEYVTGVRYRLSQWLGIDKDSVSIEMVYKYLKDTTE